MVTGASAGIGAATAKRLAGEGFTIVAGARRRDRLEELARHIDAVVLDLDVREADSIEAFATEIQGRFGYIDVLVNNAGLALGLSPVAETPDEDWTGMLDTNVLGLLRVTRALLPLLRKAPHAHIVNLGSIAGFEVYKGGAGYTATKHAVRAISRTLRLELNGEPIRVTEVAPGMVETEFSLVRFKGDEGLAPPGRGEPRPYKSRRGGACPSRARRASPLRVPRAAEVDPAWLRAAAGRVGVGAVHARPAAVDVELAVHDHLIAGVRRDRARQAHVVIDLEDVPTTGAYLDVLVARRRGGIRQHGAVERHFGARVVVDDGLVEGGVVWCGISAASGHQQRNQHRYSQPAQASASSRRKRPSSNARPRMAASAPASRTRSKSASSPMPPE